MSLVWVKCGSLPASTSAFYMLEHLQIRTSAFYPRPIPLPFPCPVPSPTHLPASFLPFLTSPYPRLPFHFPLPIFPLFYPLSQIQLGGVVERQSPATICILVQGRPKLAIWRWVDGVANWGKCIYKFT